MPAAFDVDGYLRAVRARDVEGMLVHFTDDVEVRDAGTGMVVRGKRDVRRALEEGLAAMGDLEVAAEAVVQGDREVAMLFRVRGSYASDPGLPGGGTVPVAGRRFDTEAAMFASLDQRGRIHRMTRVRDLWSAAKQLGLDPRQLDDWIARYRAGAPAAA